MENVKGKWAIITGAARGIGYLTAIMMAKEGCNLILHSRNLSHTEKVLKEVKELGVDAYAVSAELNDLDSVDDMLKARFMESHIGEEFEVTVDTLIEAGIVKNPRDGVKILGNGELTKKLTVKVNAISESAKAKIEALGGRVEVI